MRKNDILQESTGSRYISSLIERLEMQDIDQILSHATQAIKKADNVDTLEHIRVTVLGKKGSLTQLVKGLAALSPSERPRVGQAVNQAKQKIQKLIHEKSQQLAKLQLDDRLAQQSIDVSLPGRVNSDPGSLHPVTIVRQRINHFFKQMGFEIIEGPEIETEFYNFEALNIPAHHPSRAMHDTFYLSDGNLLRTHTSNVQIRAMEQRKPPLRLIAPGRVYRCDSDVSHTPMFHQLEGLFVDKDTNFAQLKAILQSFFNYFFQRELQLRFRPSYFPFTEPSAEVDISCTVCNGQGCRVCKHTGWLEVVGCGMVHPQVFKAVNIDPDQYVGWAFGLGIDRLTMLRYGIDDLRIFFENDLRFLRQF